MTLHSQDDNERPTITHMPPIGSDAAEIIAIAHRAKQFDEALIAAALFNEAKEK